MKPGETTPRNRKFIRVLDGRKQPVRGLWKRGEIFYAQFVHSGRQIKKRLQATSTAEAIRELNALITDRDKKRLKIVQHAPKLSEAIRDYKASEVFTKKRLATRKNETTYFKAWEERLGSTKVDEITKAKIVAVRDDLVADRKVGGSEEPVTNRTANLYVLALMQVLKFCEERGKLAELPRAKPLPTEKKAERGLLTDEEFALLLDASRDPEIGGKNGNQLADYLRFLALTGCREREAYRIKWKDVDLDGKILTIGADGLSKNGLARRLQMMAELEEHLRDMHSRRQPDSSYVFPSPQRGERDLPVRTFKQAFYKARVEAKLPHIGFHDFRHLFVSKLVMAGVDYMTIAQWAGHQDGGILIGKVYGHLNDAHKVATAQRLTFFDRPTNITDLPKQSAG